MREVCEFRVNEKYAHLLFGPGEGTPLGNPITGYDIRKIEISTSDPRFSRIGELQENICRTTEFAFFYGWELIRHYTKAEIAAAGLFHLEFTALVQPPGRECGTVYDHSGSCPECGCPVRQTSDLILDLRKAPKTRDIATTVHDEWIISQKLAGLMVDAGLTGFDIRPVRHKSHYESDAKDFHAVPSGRELLRRAEQAGFPHDTIAFWSWLNRSEQRELLDRMEQEWVAMRSERERRRGKPPPVWYQLVVTSKRVSTVPPTRFGGDPFDDDPKYCCSRLNWDQVGEHIAGVNVLSEFFVDHDSYDGSDVACTRECTGWLTSEVKKASRWLTGEDKDVSGGGYPSLLISPRFRRLLVDNKIRGWKTEVAYLR